MSEGVGVGVALGVVVAEGDVVGLVAEFELCPLAHTINPRRIIPTTTANITLFEAPGFCGCEAGAGATGAGATGVRIGVGATAIGVETISTRALREARMGASGITIASATFLVVALDLAPFDVVALDLAFFGAAFLVALFFTADFFTALFLTADFFTALFFAGAFLATFLTVVALDVGAFGAAFFATDFLTALFFAGAFLAVAFFTATVTPWVAVRTIGNAHVWEKVTPGLQALPLPVMQLLEGIGPCGLSNPSSLQ